jgi:anthranilate synthase/phosphoribosyltransferase
MDELTEGSLSPAFTAAVLSALNCKGIGAEEIAGCAAVLKKKKQSVQASFPVLDTCGTGGDGQHTFNISSLSALIAAAAGVKIAKHGNRAVSSKSGSSDFYKELGIRYQLSPNQSEDLINSEGFAFLFAPIYHKAMAHAAPVRREMGVKTIMNLLGPLVNPADAEYQLIGVYSNELCPIMAKAAKMTGAQRVMTVHSADGLDEISPASRTRLYMIDENGIETDTFFDPSENGINGYSVEDLKGGSAAENAETARLIINGKGPEAIKTACLLNAGAALMLAGKASSIMEGYRKASGVLEAGTLKDKVEALISVSNRMEKENGE